MLKCEEVGNVIMPIINKLYTEYAYVANSYDEFKELILKESINISKKYDDIKVYKCNIKKKLLLFLYEYTKEQITKNNFNLINNYINMNLTDTDDIDISLSNIKKLLQFLKHYKYEFSNDNISNLINNEIIEKNLKIIVKNNKQIQFNDEAKKIFNLYLMENNSQNVGTNMYSNEIKKYDVLSSEKINVLFEKYRNGDIGARDEIVKHNLRLVKYIANKYEGMGIELDDLIEEGNIGLLKAIEYFDLSRNIKFSAYAARCINSSIIRALSTQSKQINIPANDYGKFKKFKDEYEKLQEVYGRKLTIEELSRELDVSVDKLRGYFNVLNGVASLDEEINDGTLGDIICDESKPLEDKVVDIVLKSEVANLLKTSGLSQQELEVIKGRYGFNDSKIEKLVELAARMNVSRQRINQIEEKTLSKLRNARGIKYFASYMDNPKTAIERLEEYREKDNHNKNTNIRITSKLVKLYLKFNEKDSLSEKEITDLGIALNDINYYISRKIILRKNNLQYAMDEFPFISREVIDRYTATISNVNFVVDKSSTNCKPILDEIMDIAYLISESGLFNDEYPNLDSNEKLVIILIDGYIDNKTFSINDISKTLNYSEEFIQYVINKYRIDYVKKR